MKKYIPLVLVALYPYFIVATLAGVLSNLFPDSLSIILILLISSIVGLIASVGTAIVCLIRRWDAKVILRANMIIKLAQIPAYVAIYMVGMAFMITIFTAAISILLVIFDLFVIFLSGLVGLAGIISALRDKRITKTQAIIHGLLQFVFCIDVVSAIIVYRSVKAKSNHINASISE